MMRLEHDCIVSKDKRVPRLRPHKKHPLVPGAFFALSLLPEKDTRNNYFSPEAKKKINNMQPYQLARF
jgi:hypothetical protein